MRRPPHWLLVAALPCVPGCGSSAPRVQLTTSSAAVVAPSPAAPPPSAEVVATAARATVPAPGRARMPGAERANLIGSPLDYASLPLMQPVPRCRALADGSTTSSCTQSSFRFARVTVQPTCGPGQTPLSHEEWVFTATGFDRSLAARSFLRVGRSGVPFQPLVAGRYEDPRHALTNLGGRASTTFEWIVADLAGAATRGEAPLRVVRIDGTFEETAPYALSFVARATMESEVDAVPLVPGEVYAYRVCSKNCALALGDPLRVEDVALVTPSAGWLSATDIGVESTLGDEQPFTQISARLLVGASASLVVDYPARHPTKHEMFGPPAVVTSVVMLDVVWPEGDVVPEATLHLGSFDTPIGARAPAQVSARDPAEECYAPDPPRPTGVRY